MSFYLDEGARLRSLVDELLPEDWRWAGKRVLDFGCGSARVLRHFAPEAGDAEFIGCDIDASSIEWATGHLSPPFRFFRNELTPPLGLGPGSLDLILAMSVFTHITDRWADWLAEMHRLLARGGLLLASFLGAGMWEALVQDEYREDEVGMAVSRAWDEPYAWVFHSEWWLREHWGRGFDVLRVERPPRSNDGRPEVTHSHILVRKHQAEVSPEVLERLDPREERELAGLQTSLRLARRDIEYLRRRQQTGSVARGGLRRQLRKAKRLLTPRTADD
ncbi:MAG: class I SAM-dependent methyltransferase [Solirubrobacterales bacterium]|nr:class I SAM-dependent methyltransferase [Solirubrobacterales bacterium]